VDTPARPNKELADKLRDGKENPISSIPLAFENTTPHFIKESMKKLTSSEISLSKRAASNEMDNGAPAQPGLSN